MTLEELLSLPKGHKTVIKYLEWGIIYERNYQKKRERLILKQGGEFITPQPRINLTKAIADYNQLVEETILTRWLVHGIPLGANTPEMLLNAANNEDAKAEGYQLNAAFYREIAMKGTIGVPIGETLSADRVETIRTAIFGHMKTSAA